MMTQITKDVLAFINANLEANLAAVEAATGLTSDRAVYIDRFVSEGEQYPCIAVLADSTGPTEAGAGNRAYNAPNRRAHRIQIVVWHRGNRAAIRNIEDTLTVHMDAFERMFNADVNLGQERVYQNVRIINTDYSNMMVEGKTQISLLKGAVFVIEVRPNF